MPSWDQFGKTWDSGLHYDTVLPPLTTHLTSKKRSTMRHQVYFPVRIGDQIVWLRNFKIKLPTHATTLALDAGDVTAILLDVDTAIYGLDTYRGALAPASSACYQCIEVALYGDNVVGNVAWQGFTPPAGAPAAVANGCMKRVFTYIGDKIKTATGYNPAIGEDLGVEGTVAAAPPPPGSTAPDFDLRSTTDGKMEVLWRKNQFDGVRMEFDLGAAGIKSDIDLRPNYTLNWLPAAGQSVIIKVRLRYLFKGEDFGTWSDWQQWTLTGV